MVPIPPVSMHGIRNRNWSTLATQITVNPILEKENHRIWGPSPQGSTWQFKQIISATCAINIMNWCFLLWRHLSKTQDHARRSCPRITLGLVRHPTHPPRWDGQLRWGAPGSEKPQYISVRPLSLKSRDRDLFPFRLFVLLRYGDRSWGPGIWTAGRQL